MSDKPESLEGRLARIDERTIILVQMFTEMKDSLTRTYVSQEEFKSYRREMKPVKASVFGALSFIVIAVLGALINQILK